MNAFRRIFLVLALLTSVSCSPKIISFSVAPRRACPDDSIAVNWKVVGTPSVTVTKRGGLLADTLTYTLVVQRHDKRKYARQDVIRFRAAQPETLVFVTLPRGQDSLWCVDTLRAADWNSSLEIDTTASCSGRDIRLLHGGRDVLLRGDGSRSLALSGVGLEGRWELRSRLLPGEAMGDPVHSPPEKLRILVTLQCVMRTTAP